MHIAFVSFETVFHRETETNRRLHSIAELLSDGGHDVHVYCARFWNAADTGRSFVRDGITYHGVVAGTDARRRFRLRLPISLARTNADVIHAAAQPPGTVQAAWWGSRIARVPLVVEWYGADGVPDDRPHRRAAARADRILVPSKLVQRWIRELGIESTRVDVIPTPIDVEQIRTAPVGDRVDVVYARRLDSGANLESLLLALAELRQFDWRTVVLGDGPQRPMYERLASDLRIDDRVVFAGEISREERLSTYRGAHVFVQTARHCVFPTEMLWALASGCVGIVEYHRNSSAHELVEGWDRGFRTTSEPELADAILRAGELEHRTEADRFDAYDRRRIRERYLREYQALHGPP